MYYEMHETMDAATLREKQLKKWNRAWNLRLMESMNIEWEDLFDEVGHSQRAGGPVPASTGTGEMLSVPAPPGDLGSRLRGNDAVW